MLGSPDWATGVRLITIDEQEQSSITNRPARSTYPKKESVATSGATPLKGSQLAARAARDFVRNRYSWEAAARAHLNALAQIANRPETTTRGAQNQSAARTERLRS
jgi:hypothetical protein